MSCDCDHDMTKTEAASVSESLPDLPWSAILRYYTSSWITTKVMKETYDPKGIPLITKTCVTGKYVT